MRERGDEVCSHPPLPFYTSQSKGGRHLPLSWFASSLQIMPRQRVSSLSKPSHARTSRHTTEAKTEAECTSAPFCSSVSSLERREMIAASLGARW